MVSNSRPGTEEEVSTLARLLLQSGAVKFGSFTLASGKHSDFYIDVKRAWTNPKDLALIADSFADRVGNVDRLAGMELGAVPLVVATALRTGHSYVIIRKVAKEHGTRQRYEGEIPPGGKVLLIEDVSTTGGSAATSIEILRSAGAVVDRALVVVDREEGAAERLQTLGVRLEPLITLTQLRGASA
ncbi:MAG: orotate phosphoribosyltransferase [Thermoplasmata archaeon]